jgi:hypothetical protein
MSGQCLSTEVSIGNGFNPDIRSDLEDIFPLSQAIARKLSGSYPRKLSRKFVREHHGSQEEASCGRSLLLASIPGRQHIFLRIIMAKRDADSEERRQIFTTAHPPRTRQLGSFSARGDAKTRFSPVAGRAILRKSP